MNVQFFIRLWYKGKLFPKHPWQRPLSRVYLRPVKMRLPLHYHSESVVSPQDIGYIRSHYNIEDFVYYDYHRPEEHGCLHHCVLNPAFTPHTKHFIKVCSRLFKLHSLFAQVIGALVAQAKGSRVDSTFFPFVLNC